jgi:hypothetical protein
MEKRTPTSRDWLRWEADKDAILDCGDARGEWLSSKERPMKHGLCVVLSVEPSRREYQEFNERRMFPSGQGAMRRACVCVCWGGRCNVRVVLPVSETTESMTTGCAV